MKTSAAFQVLHLALLVLLISSRSPADAADTPLWDLARSQAGVHRFSTLFTAQDVKNHLSSEEGLAQAIAWCQETAVTHVYLESFRNGYQAEREALLKAKQAFTDKGFLVSGCITPTKVGKTSTGWNLISCYTDDRTQKNVQAMFEFAADLFDEIMIDDFWFTDCTCAECEAARNASVAKVQGKSYSVPGDSWAEYRCELMVRISQDLVLAPAKKVNPGARLIIKYPQWYDRFHERGYEVLRQSADFDKIWVGTETRDYTDQRWGGTPQYEAYFIMRWLGGMGGSKCGGGWYDPYGTTEATYLEQARQTVLGGARESLLFCYGSLQKDTGPKNVQALRTHIPELLRMAAEVKKRKIVGVAAYKPANSRPENEQRIYDFVGMLGLPLVPCHEFPEEAPAIFLPVHALKDPALEQKLQRYIRSGKPVLITDGLADAVKNRASLDVPNVKVLAVKGDPKSLLSLNEAELDRIRAFALSPWKPQFKAPNRVGLYLFSDGNWVVENFNDQPVQVELKGQIHKLAGRDWKYSWNYNP